MHMVQAIYTAISGILFHSDASLLATIAVPLLLLSAVIKWSRKYAIQRQQSRISAQSLQAAPVVKKGPIPDTRHREGWQE